MELRNEREAKERIRQIVRDVLQRAKLDSASPYTGTNHIIATNLQVEVKEEKHPLGDGDGFYMPGSNPTILLNPEISSQERRNFTFYHEIGHHLIRQDDALYSFIHEHSADNFNRPLEHYCNLFAAEFLMPIKILRTYLTRLDFSVTLIRELDELFPASKPAITIQLAQLAKHKCIIVICEHGKLPTRQARQLLRDSQLLNSKCLYIRYASSSPTCSYSCGRFVPIQRGHIIHTAFNEKTILKGRDMTIFRSGNNWLVPCEAFYYKGYAFAEFRFSEPQSSTQMSLFN